MSQPLKDLFNAVEIMNTFKTYILNTPTDTHQQQTVLISLVVHGGDVTILSLGDTG